MRFVPDGPNLDGVPNVFVGGAGNQATTLVVSNRPDIDVEPQLVAATCTESALRLLASLESADLDAAASVVSCDAFDVDALLAVWTITNPAAALSRRADLIATAEAASFDRSEDERLLKIVFALRGLAAVHDDAQDKFAQLLPVVPRVLDDVSAYVEHWRPELQAVQDGLAMFEDGRAEAKELPDVDLAVITASQEIHAAAITAQTERSRIAVLLPGQRYAVRYRPETWARLVSRKLPPRIDLEPLAALLETFEGNPGLWTAGDLHARDCMLRFVSDSGESSITPGLFVRMLARFLTDAATR